VGEAAKNGEKSAFYHLCILSSLGDIWSASNFKLSRSNINTLTKSSLYTNEVTDAAVRCMLDTVQRFNQKLSPRPLNYNNSSLKVSFSVIYPK
jgi:putative two-component system hydrogenase maturation factor HypX/HoxX